jgi:hypothetical protein
LGPFPIPITNASFLFIEGEALQGQKRTDHVLSHPLGLFPGLGPNPAMNIEPRVPPGNDPFHPLRAQKLLADKIGQDLPAEDLSQPRVVDPRYLMEDNPHRDKSANAK